MRLNPIEFKDIDPSLQQWYSQQIAMMNVLISEFQLTRDHHPNFMSAIKRCMTFLLFRPNGVDLVVNQQQTMFSSPKSVYDAEYLSTCIHEHSPFLFLLDAEKFNHNFLIVMDISLRSLSVLLQAQTSSHLIVLKTEMNRIIKLAKDRNWSGKINIVFAYLSF